MQALRTLHRAFTDSRVGQTADMLEHNRMAMLQKQSPTAGSDRRQTCWSKVAEFCCLSNRQEHSCKAMHESSHRQLGRMPRWRGLRRDHWAPHPPPLPTWQASTAMLTWRASLGRNENFV